MVGSYCILHYGAWFYFISQTGH